jgi:hypothetical protein
VKTEGKIDGRGPFLNENVECKFECKEDFGIGFGVLIVNPGRLHGARYLISS